MFFVRKFLLINFFTFFHSFSCAQPNLDEIFAWNHIFLQTPVDSIPNLKYVKTQNFLQVFSHNQEVKNFEGIEIEKVHYFFYNKKLYSIVIKTKESSEQAELLLGWLNLMFGEGKQVGFAPRYSWKGKKVEMLYDKNIITHQVEWRIIDVTLQKEYEKYHKKL